MYVSRDRFRKWEHASWPRRGGVRNKRRKRRLRSIEQYLGYEFLFFLLGGGGAESLFVDGALREACSSGGRKVLVRCGAASCCGTVELWLVIVD
jgi:hypothetical protein